jgi:hypothetical protein
VRCVTVMRAARWRACGCVIPGGGRDRDRRPGKRLRGIATAAGHRGARGSRTARVARRFSRLRYHWSGIGVGSIWRAAHDASTAGAAGELHIDAFIDEAIAAVTRPCAGPGPSPGSWARIGKTASGWRRSARSTTPPRRGAQRPTSFDRRRRRAIARPSRCRARSGVCRPGEPLSNPNRPTLVTI